MKWCADVQNCTILAMDLFSVLADRPRPCGGLDKRAILEFLAAHVRHLKQAALGCGRNYSIIGRLSDCKKRSKKLNATHQKEARLR
jgi:hypothetical protein